MIYILFVVACLYFLIKEKKSLHMLQQNLYNENNRYMKWVSKNKKDTLFHLDLINIILLLISILVNEKVFSYMVAFLVIFIYALLAITIYIDRKKEQKKQPLVITARVKRLIITITILFIISLLLIIFVNQKFFLLTVLFVSFNYYLTELANIINKPIEKCVYNYYKTKAKKKLKDMPNLKIIGITGSYGKTSCKNILSDILNIKYNALPTPKNLNTYYGLMITVNNHLTKFDDVFIAEMGAYVKGEIKGLCNLVNPKYGILTTIGTAHLESFGSEQNIQEGKFELIESLPADGIGVLNIDDPKQVSYKIKNPNPCKIIWVGIDNKDADYYASNIKTTSRGYTFDITFKKAKITKSFETKLLGKHNIYNILSAVALGYEFGISPDMLIKAVKQVSPVEHRLELKKLGNFYQIDDAYNSNPVGAKNALEVLSTCPGDKVVVTPGMIELGDKEEEYNREFGKQIATISKADYVILVGKKQTKAIYEGLMMNGYDDKKVMITNDVVKAYTLINGLIDKNDMYALFENDLPDAYNENE